MAGILDDSTQEWPETVSGYEPRGLHQLLGQSLSTMPPRVRGFVTETALGTIAHGFDAEAVFLVRRETGRPATVSSRIPPSWKGHEPSGLTFELFGQIWRLLDDRDARRRTTNDDSVDRVSCIGEHSVWLGYQRTIDGDLVAAVVRSQAIKQAERETLGRLVRSVAVAVGPKRPSLRGPDAPIVTVVGSVGTDGRCRADVRVELDGTTRRARGLAVTSELAVARAAAKLCEVPCHVTFAGQTELDGVVVTIVVVNDGNRSPLLGLAVTSPDANTGPAEAVFSAMSAVSAMAV